MAQSPVREIEVKPTPTEAWTMRFRVTTKNPDMPLSPVPSNHILRVGQKDWTIDQVLAGAQDAVGNWFKQELFAKLISYIKNQVTGKESLGFTLVEAAKVLGMQYPQSTRWSAKPIQSLGSSYISQDVDAAVAALSKSMGVEQSSLCMRNMTLLYPLGYDGQMYGVQKQLNQTYPQLQLLPKPDMIATNGPFALLLCNDEAATKIGTFEFHDKVKLFKDEENPDFSPFVLAFPSYSLNIFAPEQIAVLTGI